MKRTLILCVAAATVTFAALSASAAIVTISGPSTASPGDTITLTATASTGVGPADVAGVSVVGSISYQDAFVNHQNGADGQQFLVPGLGSLAALNCTTARCRAFNQIGVPGNPPFIPALTDFVVSNTFFTIDPATPAGTVLTFDWQTAPASQSLLFFGANGAVGGTGLVTVTVVPIPEPTTMAMVGLGLLGLAVAGRRRA